MVAPGVIVLGGGNWQRGSCSAGVIVLWSSCPQGSCPQGSCPRDSCPRGSCPRTQVFILEVQDLRPKDLHWFTVFFVIF